MSDLQDQFLEELRKELQEEYPWAKDQFKLDRYMDVVVGMICTGKQEMTTSERVSPVMYRVWRRYEKRRKLSAQNLHKKFHGERPTRQSAPEQESTRGEHRSGDPAGER